LKYDLPLKGNALLKSSFIIAVIMAGYSMMEENKE
jgi:hypothetical protein